MGEKIELQGHEIDWVKRLKELLWIIYTEKSRNSIEIEEYSEMSKLAHKLHMSLKNRGYEPKHHSYMLENRGVPVTEIEFYNHIHPVQDLLAFIDNTDANNDPEDSTIDVKFQFKIFTRKWGHYDVYTMKRIASGWNIKGCFYPGECNKKGEPFLLDSFEYERVSYPYNTGELLEWLWDKAAAGLDKKEVQTAMDDIAQWISICEINSPRGIFEDYYE